jgi:hypothetical protein
MKLKKHSSGVLFVSLGVVVGAAVAAAAAGVGVSVGVGQLLVLTHGLVSIL